MDTPVLFLIFNRPDNTQQVFQAIREARPKRLYVAADGPREHINGESELRDRALSIATAIDWECDLKTLVRDKNLGCRRAVSGAIDWFFENEYEGVIMEDDCLPSQSWFSFAGSMLEKYRDDERIMCISATYYNDTERSNTESYYFSIHNYCWGWASWRRAWNHYDHDMENWKKLCDTNWLRTLSGGNVLFEKHWKYIFSLAYEASKVDSWAYRWTFSCWTQSGLTVLPKNNLVKNIGISIDSTHTDKVNKYMMNANLEEIEFPIIHPKNVVRDIDKDEWDNINIFGITWHVKLKTWLKSIPIVGGLLLLIKGIFH